MRTQTSSRFQFSLSFLLGAMLLEAVLIGAPFSLHRVIEIDLLALYGWLLAAMLPVVGALIFLRLWVDRPGALLESIVAIAGGCGSMLLVCLAVNPTSLIDLIAASCIGASAGALVAYSRWIYHLLPR